jgi:hypothetical protein
MGFPTDGLDEKHLLMMRSASQRQQVGGLSHVRALQLTMRGYAIKSECNRQARPEKIIRSISTRVFRQRLA